MEGRAITLGEEYRSCRKPCRSMASVSTSPEPLRDVRRSTRTCQLALPSVFVVVLAIVFVPTATEAGVIGGRNVPWWYPLREWVFGTDGLDNNAHQMGWTVGSISRRTYRKKAFIAKEFVENCVALGLGEDEQSMEAMPQCSIHEVTNKTLRKLGASIDECASPYYRLTEIHPSQLQVYTEVDPVAEAAEKRRREEEEGRRKHSSEGEEKGKAVGKAGATVDGAEEQLSDLFLGIFVFLKGDFFSVELENALTAIAPSYPEAWVVKADATVFLSFCVQYHLYTFPQLLLFKNGRLVSKYRGRRSIEELAAWFSLNTGHFPKTIPLRALPHPPRRHPLSLPGLDEPLTWAALLYAATKAVSITAWFLKRRRGEAGGQRGAGRGTGGLAGRVGRLGRWLAGAFIRRVRGGGGQGRRRAAVEPDNGLREDDRSVREGT